MKKILLFCNLLVANIVSYTIKFCLCRPLRYMYSSASFVSLSRHLKFSIDESSILSVYSSKVICKTGSVLLGIITVKLDTLSCTCQIHSN